MEQSEKQPGNVDIGIFKKDNGKAFTNNARVTRLLLFAGIVTETFLLTRLMPRLQATFCWPYKAANATNTMNQFLIVH